MVDSSQRAGKCTRPTCRELAHAYRHAWRSVWPFQPVHLSSSTERGHQKDHKTRCTITRALPPGHALAISHQPERLLLSYNQSGCGPAQSAFLRFEVPRHLRPSSPPKGSVTPVYSKQMFLIKINVCPYSCRAALVSGVKACLHRL